MPTMYPGKNWPGSSRQIKITFRDDDGALIDPTTVAFKTYAPFGPAASYTYGTDTNVIRAGTGRYYAIIVPSEAGRWHYRWEATVEADSEVLLWDDGTEVLWDDGVTVTWDDSTPTAIASFAEEGSFLVMLSPFFEGTARAYEL